MGDNSVLKELGDLVENIFLDVEDTATMGGKGKKYDGLHADGEQGHGRHPHSNIEKAAVLQEARMFHDSIAVRESPDKCCRILCQLIRIQDIGYEDNTQLTEMEATDVFFGCTKLFVSNDASLRRMVYLFLKEICALCDPSNVIIVTSCLTKDMSCEIDLYRANSLRVLSKIIDAGMLGAIERYTKQAIVDKSPKVASAALVSAIHLFRASPDCAAVIKRWIPEIKEAISDKMKSNYDMVQFHGISLLYQIKAHDRLGVSKLVSQYSQAEHFQSSSPMAVVCLIRYTSKLLQDEVTSGRADNGSITTASTICREGYQFLQRCLGAASAIVVYEAACAICSLYNIEPEDLHAAIAVLRAFLSSEQSAVKFAAVKTLSNMANKFPRLVAKCNVDLVRLIRDQNKELATLAVTTLLKTGSENGINDLLGKISSFLVGLEDEYRITVVQVLQQLCLVFPAKHELLVGFMCNFLRGNGGFEFKSSIVSTITTLMRMVPETIVNSLLCLSDFIEDCEYVNLSTELIHILGKFGPTTNAPARYIPILYNRILLETSEVRAAAVLSLTRFATLCPSLRASILLLLKRCLQDDDDETRDRAATAVSVLEDAISINPFMPPHVDADQENIPPDIPADDDIAAYAFATPFVSFDTLERRMHAYMRTPHAMESIEPITLAALPIVEDSLEASTEVSKNQMGGIIGISTLGETANGVALVKERNVDPAEIIYAIPELAELGRVFRSCPAIQLTESETEYVVQCIKHVFVDHVVLQFKVENTIEDQRLDNVRVAIEIEDEEEARLYEAIGEIVADGIGCGTSSSCLTILKRNTDAPLSACSFSCQMKFTVVSVDATSGEEMGDSPFEEEYTVEDFSITTSDYMAKVSVQDFRTSWEGANPENEVLEKYALPFKRHEDAVAAVINALGMQPCNGTSAVQTASSGRPHMLHLSGIFIGGVSVLARAQIAVRGGGGSTILKIAVRSEDEDISRVVADSIN